MSESWKENRPQEINEQWSLRPVITAVIPNATLVAGPVNIVPVLSDGLIMYLSVRRVGGGALTLTYDATIDGSVYSVDYAHRVIYDYVHVTDNADTLTVDIAGPTPFMVDQFLPTQSFGISVTHVAGGDDLEYVLRYGQL